MMKSTYFVISVFLIFVLLLPAASCGGGPAASQSVITTPQETTTPPSTPTTTEPPTPSPTTTIPTTIPAPGPTPETTTPTAPKETTTTPPPDTADLQPYAIDGKSIFFVDASSKDYREFKIKTGIINAGVKSIESVEVALYEGYTRLYTWDIEKMDAGENVILETTVGSILEEIPFSPGVIPLNIRITVPKNSQEISDNNKSESEEFIIACQPVEKQPSTSDVGKMIQDSIEKSTWYTNGNRQDLITIIKDVLKDARIQWSTVHIEIKSYDDYNDYYADTYGTTEQQKKEIKTWLESNPMVSSSFIWGTTANPQISLREGTLIQLLPILFSRLGNLSFSQANYPNYREGLANGFTTLVEMMINAYGFSVLRDNYGFKGLANVAFSTEPSPSIDIFNDLAQLRVWSLTAGISYSNGDVPSAELLKLYKSLLSNQNTAAFMDDLDKSFSISDTEAINNIIQWRMVNKDATLLPAEVTYKIDPDRKSISLDSLICYQDFVLLPW